MSRNASFDQPDRFTVGAVGEPGERVFYLQATQAADVLTLRLEKQQVAALATYLEGVLADTGGAPTLDPSIPLALVTPIEPDWTVGSLAIGVEEDGQRIVIAAEELIAEGDEDDPLRAVPGAARIAITRSQAGAFVPHAEALVSSGRPVCELCGRPMDPSGHVCPRKNGHGAH
ncbi:MAG: DUF3090 family protein [Acidimicrobiales bacterium]